MIGIRHSGGGGSGFVISRDGLALTNYHVVADGQEMRAVLRDGRRLPLRVLRVNEDADVALVQVACIEACHALTVTTRTPPIGTDVYVVGNPLGLDHTLTAGVVSGIRRQGSHVPIQTDATVNPEQRRFNRRC